MPSPCLLASPARPPAPPRERVFQPSTAPARTSWKISQRPASSVRRMRCSASTSRTPRTSVLGTTRELRQVGRLVGDLRPRRSDEVIEELRRDLALHLASAPRSHARGDRRPPAPRRQARSSVAARSVDEPCARSTSQSRCITSCRYGASIPDARPLPLSTARAARAELDPCRCRRRRARRRRARPRSSRSRPRARLHRSSGLTIAARPASRSRRSRRRTFANRFGIAAFSRSSVASVSSRSESSTLTRSGPSTSRRERGVEAVALGVIREVLLRLVEHQVDVPVGLSARRDVDERARLDARLPRPARERARARAPRSSSRRRRRAAPPGRARSARATLASSSDDLPTPLGP